MDIRIVEKRKVQNGVEIDKYFIIELQNCYDSDGNPWYIPLENEIDRHGWRFPSFEEAKKLKEDLSKLNINFKLECSTPDESLSSSYYNPFCVDGQDFSIELRQNIDKPNSYYFLYFKGGNVEYGTKEVGLKIDNVNDLITHLYETITITTSTIVG